MNLDELSDTLLDHYEAAAPFEFDKIDDTQLSVTHGMQVALALQGHDMLSIAAEIAWIWSGQNYKELTQSIGGYHEFILKEPAMSEVQMEAHEWMQRLAEKKKIPMQQAGQALESKFKELKVHKDARGADGKPDNAKALELTEKWLKEQGVETRKKVVDRPAGGMPGGMNTMLRNFESVHMRDGNHLVIGSDQLATVIEAMKALRKETNATKIREILKTAPLHFSFYNPGKLGKSDFSDRMNSINGLYAGKFMLHSIYFRPVLNDNLADGICALTFAVNVHLGVVDLIDDFPRVWAVMQGFCNLVLAAGGFKSSRIDLHANFMTYTPPEFASNDQPKRQLTSPLPYHALLGTPVFEYTGKDMTLDAEQVLAAFTGGILADGKGSVH